MGFGGAGPWKGAHQRCQVLQEMQRLLRQVRTQSPVVITQTRNPLAPFFLFSICRIPCPASRPHQQCPRNQPGRAVHSLSCRKAGPEPRALGWLLPLALTGPRAQLAHLVCGLGSGAWASRTPKQCATAKHLWLSTRASSSLGHGCVRCIR